METPEQKKYFPYPDLWPTPRPLGATAVAANPKGMFAKKIVGNATFIRNISAIESESVSRGLPRPPPGAMPPPPTKTAPPTAREAPPPTQQEMSYFLLLNCSTVQFHCFAILRTEMVLGTSRRACSSREAYRYYAAGRRERKGN